MITEENSEGVDFGSAIRERGARWGQDRRLEFIEYRLRWAGHLNRSDLTDFFGISVPQASLDLAEYTRRAPGNLTYDRSTRTYVLAGGFNPLFKGTNHESYLNDLLRQAYAIESIEESFLGWHPVVAVPPTPWRHLDGQTVGTIVEAIRSNRALRLVYQSLSRLTPFSRKLTPHSLVYDGQRWHVRAYCHTRQDFRDFLISRILEIEGTESDHSRASEDSEWNNLVSVVLSPHPALPEPQRRAIELDYGMVGGICKFQCREALLFYVLRQLRLDQPETTPPEAQQIVLANRSELEPLLPKAGIR
ncbi:MAG: helix-turn-helix transcriptional regulator [Bryobacteraceae bacterium]